MAAIRGEENKSCAVSAFLLLITLFLLSANGQKAQSARSADDYFNQGLFQYHRGNLNGASADFSRAIAINPQLALAYYYRGTIRAIRGNWDAAIADYSKEIDIDPTHALAYYNRGVARFAKWDLDGALADFNASLTINPDHAEAYYNRGVIRQAKADLNSAIDDFDMAIKINPHYPEAYNNRGAARQETGDLNGAVSDFNQAIKFDPHYAEAYANRGMAFLLEGNERAAEHDFEHALRLNKTLKVELRERIKKTNTLRAAKQPLQTNRSRISIGEPDEMMAYLDPGSGTLIWQLVILSFFLGAIFFIGKFKGWVLSRTQRAKEPPATTQNPLARKKLHRE